jgi:transposase
MRKALPILSEDIESLKQRLQHEHDGRKRPRLHMLYLLASGQAQTRWHVAQLLGVHRNTIGHWLALYETGGLEALLDVYIPAGKPLSLPLEVLAALEQALRQPAGFASYEALRQWVKQTHHLEVNYHTLYTIVRTKLKAKLKVPRPSHTKKPGRHPGISSDLSRAAGTQHSA